MHWYFQIRVGDAERSTSRVLQVLDTQRIKLVRFEALPCLDAMHIRFVLAANEHQANRVGLLLRRSPAITSAHWVAILNAAEEHRLWTQTALAAWSEEEREADLDPASSWWQAAPSILLQTDNAVLRLSGHDTEVRMRWTAANLYVLFDCAYDDLHLRPEDSVLAQPTPSLWEHDVAEIFLGTGDGPRQDYMEFEVSPRGEWIALEITAQDGIIYSTKALHSSFMAAATLCPQTKRWAAFLRIPLSECATHGTNDLRLNLFRSQGPTPVELAWQPTGHVSFHVPSHFGYLRLLHE